MRWKSGRRSQNVEDRRGRRVPKAAGVGGLGVLVVAVVAMLLGVDPKTILQAGSAAGGGSSTPGVATEVPPGQEQLVDFVHVVLGDTEDVWNELFRTMGREYQEPTLVLFTDAVQSACGQADAAVGPFYCPGDDNVYIDLSFFDDLSRRFAAPGDFAQAYVIAHEIGHHVQNQLGISGDVHRRQRALGEAEKNELSVQLELQADFFAGVWAHHAQRARKILETGDVEEALAAATAIGDDRLQMQSRGYVAPDSFTHGTSEQRVRWFRRGLETGDVEAGDTFNARDL